jgi:hypothetical protein
MISLLGDQQEFEINVHPNRDWASSKSVLIEVLRNGVLEGDETSALPKMTWDHAYEAFATQLEVNEHQLASMAKGLDRGRVLWFRISCRRSDLAAVGFIRS